MNFEFMTIGTPLPPCMPFPRALTGFPVSSTAKVMYCRMLDAMLSNGQEDENGILFICFPVTAIAAVLSRSPMTVKRSLNGWQKAPKPYREATNKREVSFPDLQYCRTFQRGIQREKNLKMIPRRYIKTAYLRTSDRNGERSRLWQE